MLSTRGSLKSESTIDDKRENVLRMPHPMPVKPWAEQLLKNGELYR
jgi:hypothetical protein